jgi:hypothetical protein|tara:strand:+ start:177 stop:398 length:222 start_codon:yes stop_codon:yes gene_type:complete
MPMNIFHKLISILMGLTNMENKWKTILIELVYRLKKRWSVLNGVFYLDSIGIAIYKSEIHRDSVAINHIAYNF